MLVPATLSLIPPAVAAEHPETRYTLEISGVENKALETALEDNSLLKALQDHPPASQQALKRRAEEDIDRFQSILRANSYYDARVEPTFAPGEPTTVTMQVTPGPAYLLGAFVVEPQGCANGDCASTPDEDDLKLTLGAPARSADIVAAERRVRTWFRNRGHPDPDPAAMDVVVDHKLRGVFVTLPMTPGPMATLGDVRISGAPDVDHDYLARLKTWSVGGKYDARLIDEYRRKLEATGLFASVTVAPVLPAENDKVPVTVDLVQREARSIGAGVNYSTSEGPGVTAFWEHRNILGADEDLRVEGTASMVRQSVGAQFLKPAFMDQNQDLLASTELANKYSDAFDSRTFTSQIGIERRPRPDIRTGLSLLFEAAQISDAEGTRNSYLFGVPVALTWDKRDTPLDAHTGHIVSGTVIPFAGIQGTSIYFSHFETSAAKYLQLFDEPDVVFAVRGRLGSLIGADTDEIPATRRFYAGGGGSIRGYEFEKVGPLDDNNNPLGGRSVVELGAELRVRTVWDIGIVPFVDAGNVYDAIYPDFDDPLQWAAGLGFRYYTPIGPLRLDFAVPINRRPNVDDAFQFYVSLGQAF
jgi:translocation and assembly module TamA